MTITESPLARLASNNTAAAQQLAGRPDPRPASFPKMEPKIMSTAETQTPRTLSAEQISKALAAAQQFSGVTLDLLDAARVVCISPFDNIGSGDTATIAADGLRLLLEASDATEDPDEATTQLYGALIRYLEDRT